MREASAGHPPRSPHDLCAWSSARRRRALFFDDPRLLSEDEERVVFRVLARLSTPKEFWARAISQGERAPWR